MGDVKKVLIMAAVAAAVLYAYNNMESVTKFLGPKK